MKCTMVLVEIRSKFPGFSGHYSEGVASIAATLKSKGHDFELLHVTRPVEPVVLAGMVAKTAPDLVGFSTMTNTFGYVQKYAPAVKSSMPDVPVILGGVHAILCSEECIVSPGIDAVCIGEGEEFLLSLMSRMESGSSYLDLAGAWFKKGSTIYRNNPLPLIRDLDSLPIPDRKIFNFQRLVSSLEGVAYIVASRGCPYSCKFCCNAALRSTYKSEDYVRFKSPGRLRAEIASTIDLFSGNLQGIYFQDDILPLNEKWFRDFTEMYRTHINIPFNCNIRADLIDEEIIKRLKSAGCKGVSIGLETGVERIRKDTLGKNIPNERYFGGVKMLKDAGIGVSAFSMIGIPGETVQDILKTIEMNASLSIDRPLVSIFFPYPGTELFDKCSFNISNVECMPDTYQERTVICKQDFTSSQIMFVYDYFELLIYLTRLNNKFGFFEKVIKNIVMAPAPVLNILCYIKRGIYKLLLVSYMSVGRYFIKRQSKIFN